MNISTLFLVFAAIFFALDALHVTIPQISWTPLGFCFVTIGALIL